MPKTLYTKTREVSALFQGKKVRALTPEQLDELVRAMRLLLRAVGRTTITIMDCNDKATKGFNLNLLARYCAERTLQAKFELLAERLDYYSDRWGAPQALGMKMIWLMFVAEFTVYNTTGRQAVKVSTDHVPD